MEIEAGVFISEQKQKPCEWCEQNESTLFCIKCETHQLCENCSKLIHSKQKLKSHLETIFKISEKFNIEHYICSLHERENDFYCCDCSSFICHDCAFENEGKHSKHQFKTTKIWKNEFLDTIEKNKGNYTTMLESEIISRKDLLEKLEVSEKKIQDLQFAISKISLGFGDISQMIDFNHKILGYSQIEDFSFIFDGTKSSEIISNGKIVSTKLGSSYKICTSSFKFKKEKIYFWRIKINSFHSNQGGVGIIQSNISTSDCNTHLGNYHGYSYHGHGKNIIAPLNIHTDVFEAYGKGDIISVIFDLKKKKLLFEKNGRRNVNSFDIEDTSVDFSPAVCLFSNSEMELIECKLLENY
jgi:hypothetical protein